MYKDCIEKFMWRVFEHIFSYCINPSVFLMLWSVITTGALHPQFNSTYCLSKYIKQTFKKRFFIFQYVLWKARKTKKYISKNQIHQNNQHVKSHGFVCTQIPVKPFEIYTQTLKYKDREREMCIKCAKRKTEFIALFNSR